MSFNQMKWLNELEYFYIMEYYGTIEKLPSTDTQNNVMDLKEMISSPNKSPSKKIHTERFNLYNILKITKF